MADHFKVAIVGSGPGGLSAAAHAAAVGMDHVLLEKTDHVADTLFKFQKGKHVMSTPDVLPLRADIEFGAGRREDILEKWNNAVSQHNINVRYKSEVTAIVKDGGSFTITVSDGSTLTADNVILGIGMQGNLRKMGVPGEDWEGVQYQLDDPDAYEDESIVIVGAGDAAIENAIALAKQNKVYIVNRRDEFARAKQGNLDLISEAIESGKIDCFYSSNPAKVEPGVLTLKTPDGEADVPVNRVIARLGAIPPRKFVESCGIVFPSDAPGALPEVSPTYESNVPGLYIVGSLGGFPLIKQAINQGWEVIETLQGNAVKPADEPLIEDKLTGLPGVSVDDFIAQVRDKIPLYHDVQTLMLREMMLDSNVHVFNPGDVVFEKDDYTNSFYAVLDGEVSIQVVPDNPNITVDLGSGQFFGEMGLISGRRRTATVVAKGRCVLLETNRRTMVKLINSVDAVKDVLDRTALTRQIQTYMVPNASAEQLEDVVASATIQVHGSGDVLFSEGDPGDSVHLVRRGSLTVSRMIGGRDITIAYVAAGNYVGEMALLHDAPRSATIKAAVNGTEVIRLDGDQFNAMLANHPQLRTQFDEVAQQRTAQNVRASEMSDAGSLIEFLVQQGGGEATDILLIDESLCIRCDNCERACAETHNGNSRLNREAGPTYATIHVPTSCRHCEHPHCMKECPPDAIHRAPDGEVFMDSSCIGCGNCSRNCPYGVIHMAPAEEHKKPGLLQWLLFGRGPGPGADMSPFAISDKKVATKCDMCKDVPGGASCVRACPTGAAMRVRPEEFFQVAISGGK